MISFERVLCEVRTIIADLIQVRKMPPIMEVINASQNDGFLNVNSKLIKKQLNNNFFI